MTVTLGSKTLNLLGLREISEVKAVKTDRWENGGYKRRYSPIGLLRKWRLECIEKNVAWNESAIKYLEEQAAQATKLDFIFPGKLNETCVLHLPFDEGGGSIAYDKSGNNNNGTIYGATWTDGKFGKALNFGGVEGVYVEVADDPSLALSELTLCAWVKTNGEVTHDNKIIQKYPEASPWNGYGLYISWWWSPGTAGIWVGDLDGGWLHGTTRVDDGEWHFVVGTFDGTIARIYVDGVLDAAEERTPNLASTVNLYVGSNTNGEQVFEGIIDEVRVYNRALSADEIWQLYLSGGVRVGAKTLMPTDVGESFELVGCEWDAFENESYVRKLAVLGDKRSWQITCIEKNVPWNYSATKYLQCKAWKGEPVYFKARLNSRYETEEVEAYITGLELNIPNIADKNIRHITVILKEA